ncbi:hypothetical protein [Halomicrobium katesii]|uniref:hypothetical protein n=1 Tax=Halomicrobium katesii TaxID=437163 RepID=UPI000381D8F8|nr:hypothetical protein [Halomicrobium katesii]
MTNPHYGEAEFLCYQVIKQVRERYGQSWDLPKTEFYKLCYIVDRRLQEEDIDIELSTHWYRYGGVLTTDAMNTGFYSLEEQTWGENAGSNVLIADGVEDSDFDTDEEVERAISEMSESVVDELGQGYGISVSQDYQYKEYAPDDFVRSLHEFRSFIQDIDEDDALNSEDYISGVDVGFKDIIGDSSPDKTGSSASSETNNRIRDHLDALLAEYPEDKYSQMEGLFLDWENLSWQMAKNGFYSRLQDFMESFWTTFSRVELRPKNNQHVPLSIRSQWNNQISDEMESFENEIQEKREVVLNNRRETNELDIISESYSDTARDLFDQPLQNE